MKLRRALSWASDHYEYAFTPVPQEGRKSTSNVRIVTLGYTVALSCLVIGTKVGYALPFWQAVGACVVGNLILICIGIFMGSLGCETGWSTAFLARKMFGKLASNLVSGLVILLAVYWVGMNGDSFARMIVSTFPRWPVPVPVTAVLLVALWGLTAAYGWKGLELTSRVLTPMTLLLALAGVYLLFARMDVVGVLGAFIPSGRLTMTSAIAAVTGNYIFGCIISPDLCRFAKSRRAVVQIILPAHSVGFIVLNLCGVLVAQLGNSYDFGAATAKLGLALPYLICAAMGLWTTENYNIYGGSLAAQNLFQGTPVEGNLSHWLASWILAGLAAAFAALKALNYLMPIITLISILVPPVAGMMCAECLVFRRDRRGREESGANWIWMPAWIAGGLAGICAYYTAFLIPPVAALLTSGLVYLVLRLGGDRRKRVRKIKK